MSLSCSCYDGDDYKWFFTYCPDFTNFKGKRRKRCCSCKALINIGDEVVGFERFRYPASEVEQKIFGDGNKIKIADWWMCEKCGEIFLNLDALGYCIDLSEPMTELLKEYHEMTGFKPKEAAK